MSVLHCKPCMFNLYSQKEESLKFFDSGVMFTFLRPAKQCPLGLHYRECISCCPESCNLERTCIDSKLACLDGCYCPDGEFDLLYLQEIHFWHFLFSLSSLFFYILVTSQSDLLLTECTCMKKPVFCLVCFLMFLTPVGNHQALLTCAAALFSPQVWSMRTEAVWCPLTVPVSTMACSTPLDKRCRRNATTGEQCLFSFSPKGLWLKSWITALIYLNNYYSTLKLNGVSQWEISTFIFHSNLISMATTGC